MEYLLKFWDRIKERIKKVNQILLFLDYDGTLTPITERPDKAIISEEMKELLRGLSDKCKLAIISGRALKDIKNLVGVRRIIYAGNHGLEIEGEKIKFKSPITPKLKALMERIKEELNKRFGGIKGVFVEDKELSLSLHYRLADRKDIKKIKDIFDEVTRPYFIKDKIRIDSGKKVLEVRPPVQWDKGKVVLWLLARQKFIFGDEILPIYIGDDITDEDAFCALKDKGLTIFVGKPKSSYAQYYLKNTKEVFEFLRRILNLQIY